MIERIFTEPVLPEHGIEAQKIRALFQAYGTGYDFCKFFKQGSAVLAYLDGSSVLYCDNNADFSELSDFLQVNGFSDLFCSEDVADMLSKYIPADYQKVISMKFSGNSCPADIRQANSLSDLFSIVSTGFDIEFELVLAHDCKKQAIHSNSGCGTDIDTGKCRRNSPIQLYFVK